MRLTWSLRMSSGGMRTSLNWPTPVVTAYARRLFSTRSSTTAACAIDGHAGLGLKHYGTALVDHGGDVIQRQIVAIDMKYFHTIPVVDRPGAA